MIRPAKHDDLPRILAIRDDPGDAPLSDPGALTEAATIRLIGAAALWVWQDEDGSIAGVAGIDAADGSVLALLVAPGQEGRGIGRALLNQSCDALRAAGCRTAMIRLPPDTRAQRHYRAAGWTASGHSAKVLKFWKAL